MIRDHAGEKVVEETKDEGQAGGAKEKEAHAAKSVADKEVARKTKENSDKGNSLQNVSEETMAQFSGTSKEVSSRFLFDNPQLFNQLQVIFVGF